MNLLFDRGGLAELDELGCEALVLPLFEDERPPRGLLGVVDWRFAGRISDLIARGLVDGSRGRESVLPARARLPSIDKLFIVGMGETEGFDEARFEAALHGAFDLAESVKLRTVGMSLPGRSLDLIAPVRAIEIFLGIADRRAGELAEITILDDAAALREMDPVIAMARRRMRARISSP